MKISKKKIRQDVLVSAEKYPESLRKIARSSLKNEQIQWFHEKEFLWKGQMFDVIRTEQKDNQEILYCFMDTKEKELLAKYFNDFINGKMRADWLLHLYKLIQSDILLIENDYHVCFVKNLEKYPYRFIASQAYYPVPFKPPLNESVKGS